MACNECCTAWALMLLHSLESAREATKRSEYTVASELAGNSARRYISKLKEDCNLSIDKMKAFLDEAISHITQAEIAHQETAFSGIGLSMAAEGTFSKEAQVNLNMVIAELENAVRERARELNCEV